MTSKKSPGALSSSNSSFDLNAPRRNRAAASPSLDTAIAKIEREMQKLRALAEIGLGKAEAVSREMADVFAGPAAGGKQRRDPIEAFERIASAVRRAIVLEEKLAAELRSLKLKREAEQAAAKAEKKRARPAERIERQDAGSSERKEWAKQEIKRIAEEAIKAASRSAERERLLVNLDDRLAEPDIEADCGERPISAVVARLCTDLGIVPNWQRWSNEPWAIHEARLNVPGSPFAGRRIGLQ